MSAQSKVYRLRQARLAGVSLLASFVLSNAFEVASAQSLIWLGTLGGNASEAYKVSADGSTVVGRSRDSQGWWHAFRWTAQEGMQDLGTLGTRYSEAHGVSADGSVVVGDSEGRAFYWTAQSGMRDLGTLRGGDYSSAFGVSADGSIVVGSATDSTGVWHAFRWTT